jgi:hypothetical protein
MRGFVVAPFGSLFFTGMLLFLGGGGDSGWWTFLFSSFVVVENSSQTLFVLWRHNITS